MLRSGLPFIVDVRGLPPTLQPCVNAALAVLAASSAEAFTGSAFTGMTPKLRTSAVSTRAAATVGPDMSLVLVTGAR